MNDKLTRRRFLSGATALAGGLLYRDDARAAEKRHGFAVIGRGPMGSAAARHLAAAGEDVLVVGPEEPADGQQVDGALASHYDEARQVEFAGDSKLLCQLSRASVKGLREVERETSIRFYQDNANLRVAYPAYAAEGWKPARGVARELDVELQDLTDADLAARFPELRFPAGSRGLLEPGGGIINPRAMVRAQLAAAQKYGATVVNDTAVTLRRKPGEVVVETRGGRTLRADQVLVATGAFTNTTGLLDRRLALSPFGVTVVMVETPAGPHPEMPTITWALEGESGPQVFFAMPPREYPDGRWYIKGATFSTAPEPTESERASDTSSRGPVVENAPALMAELLGEMMPGLETGATKNRPCFVAYTSSGAPYIDRLDDRIGVAAGCNAWGVMTSDEIGRLAAARMRGEGWSGPFAPEVFEAHFA
jgi:sarcosine oxidase